VGVSGGAGGQAVCVFMGVPLSLWLAERWKTEEGGIEIHLGNKTVNCLDSRSVNVRSEEGGRRLSDEEVGIQPRLSNGRSRSQKNLGTQHTRQTGSGPI
jgi:hypothetical protein